MQGIKGRPGGKVENRDQSGSSGWRRSLREQEAAQNARKGLGAEEKATSSFPARGKVAAPGRVETVQPEGEAK